MPAATTQLEASADTDVPDRSWAEVCSAATTIATTLFTHGTVAVRAVGIEEIRRLNREHRGIDAATDVLSFPAGAAALHGHHGDIALCWPVAERQAHSNGNSVASEAVALLAHGMLHLAGLDHDTPEAGAEMDMQTLRLCQVAGHLVRTYGH